MNRMNRTLDQQGRKWSEAALRISGDTLHPSHVSASLGLEATQSGIKGERFSPRHNALRRTSFWILKSPLGNYRPLEEHLNWLLDVLEPKCDLLISIRSKWKTEFFCGFSSENGQGGVTLDLILLGRLARLGISLVLDLYPPESSLEVEVDTNRTNLDG